MGYGKPQLPVGTIIGNLKVISTPIRVMKAQMRTCVLCECICGKETIVNLYDLIHGHYQSCGCLKYELIGNAKRTHGESWREGRRTPEYHIWDAIRQRCNNPNNKGYKDYGGRGIRMSEEWNSYEKFIAYVGRRPSEDMSLDRINNDGNYEPGNVRWATQAQQDANKRNSRKVEFRGEIKCLFEWVKELGLNYGTVHNRLDYGWTAEEAFTVKAVKGANQTTIKRKVVA